MSILKSDLQRATCLPLSWGREGTCWHSQSCVPWVCRHLDGQSFLRRWSPGGASGVCHQWDRDRCPQPEIKDMDENSYRKSHPIGLEYRIWYLYSSRKIGTTCMFIVDHITHVNGSVIWMIWGALKSTVRSTSSFIHSPIKLVSLSRHQDRSNPS